MSPVLQGLPKRAAPRDGPLLQADIVRHGCHRQSSPPLRQHRPTPPPRWPAAGRRRREPGRPMPSRPHARDRNRTRCRGPTVPLKPEANLDVTSIPPRSQVPETGNRPLVSSTRKSSVF
jgi:hypothetical protein